LIKEFNMCVHPLKAARVVLIGCRTRRGPDSTKLVQDSACRPNKRGESKLAHMSLVNPITARAQELTPRISG
jgi:hypothetical protein